jgi:hypothetical protein
MHGLPRTPRLRLNIIAHERVFCVWLQQQKQQQQQQQQRHKQRLCVDSSRRVNEVQDLSSMTW